VIIDAADEPDTIIALAEGTAIDRILTTHGHWDHHQAVLEVAERLGVPTCMHPADLPLADKAFDIELAAGAFAIGGTNLEIIHTPGHTPGSMCVVLDGAVLTGDTLFPGGPGATRFDHSDFDTIIESISTKLFTLDGGTVVLPGHGAATTIGVERPHLAEWIERGW
jgi:glyoxylase-like metal-dependent hydrolase (beta-lactamase superfamily II)